MRFLVAMLVLAGVASAHAASTALIVVGLTASESDAAQWQQLATQARTGLAARGIASENITVIAAKGNQPVTRDDVLAAFAKIQAVTGKDDACWILLLGHSAPGRDGAPAFQLRGPRFTAADLHDALAGFSGPTDVLLGTELSSDYLPVLKTLPHCTAVAASGGPTVPRFPEFWVNALTANPKANFAELAVTAAESVAAFYKKESLAQGENSELLAEQAIQEAPFAPVFNTTINDSWNLTQQPDGSWRGQLERKLTGLEDKALREQLRPLNPEQRTHLLQTHLTALFSDIGFSNLTVNDLSNLEAPVAVKVEVTCPISAQPPGPDQPVPFATAFPPGVSFVEELATPERDLPLLVNDGQTLRYEQQVKLTFNHLAELAAMGINSSNAHAAISITYTHPGAQILVRNTTLEIAAPTVPAADYAAFRKAILDWRRALAAPFFLTHS